MERGYTPPADYDLVVNIRYVNLPLLTNIRSLRPGGALLVEQHLALPDLADDVVGPRNPRFRVAPAALRKVAEGLRIEVDEEGLLQDPDGETAALARLLAFRD